jgi:hypothetical protein
MKFNVGASGGTGNSWADLLGVTNSTTDRAIFMSMYGGNAVLAVHNAALNAWADLYINTVDGTTGMVVKGNGNVGIGTTSPSAKLTIDNGSASGGSLLKSSNSSYTAHFIANTSTGSAGIYMDAMNGDFVGSDYGFIGQNNAGYMEYTVSPSSPLPYHYFAQNVGIGNTNPSAKLSVNSDALGSAVGSQTRQALFSASDGNTSHLEIKDIRSSTVQNWTGAGKRIQCRVDSTYMAYMQFNGTGNNYGISFGTGSTTTAPGNVAEKMRIEDSGDVGIGTTNPGAKLEVNGDILLTYLKATGNSVIGGSNLNSSRLSVQDSKNGTANSPHFQILGNGYSAYHYLDTTAYNISTNSASREIRIIASTGGVKLTVNATAWVSNSDIALKENIKPLENVLDKIKDYRCVEYNLKESPEDKKIGFIAQDWVDDFPAIVNKDEKNMLGMKYTETIPVLLKAIQELTAKVKELENK